MAFWGARFIPYHPISWSTSSLRQGGPKPVVRENYLNCHKFRDLCGSLFLKNVWLSSHSHSSQVIVFEPPPWNTTREIRTYDSSQYSNRPVATSNAAPRFHRETLGKDCDKFRSAPFSPPTSAWMPRPKPVNSRRTPSPKPQWNSQMLQISSNKICVKTWILRQRSQTG